MKTLLIVGAACLGAATVFWAHDQWMWYRRGFKCVGVADKQPRGGRSA